jgi:hypothetical protein
VVVTVNRIFTNNSFVNMSDFVTFHKGGGYSSEIEDDRSSVGNSETESVISTKSTGTLHFKVRSLYNVI